MSAVKGAPGQEGPVHHPTEFCEIISAPIHYVSEEEAAAVRRRSDDEREAALGLLDLSLGPRHWSALRAHIVASQIDPAYLGVRPLVFNAVFSQLLEMMRVYYFALTDPWGRVLCVLKSDYGRACPYHESYLDPSIINSLVCNPRL